MGTKQRGVRSVLAAAAACSFVVASGISAPLILPAAAATGQVSHWGSFFPDGQDALLSPATVTLPGTVVQVATSNTTQYALLENGEVYAWGRGTYGQLGNGGTSDSLSKPVRVHFPKGVMIASLPTDALPYDSALAIDTTGRVWGWGHNSAGELCLGNKTVVTVPAELPLTNVTAAAGAGDHALYLAGGTLYACGDNKDGDLGDGSTTPSWTPVKVTGLDSQKPIDLVASYRDSGVLLSDGAVDDWGLDSEGQLGDGQSGVSSSVPVEVHLPATATQIAQGGSYGVNGQTLVMLSDGTMYAWGADQCGQLGDGGRTEEDAPVPFSAPAGVTYRTLASGGSASYAITTTGSVYAWGCNDQGQIGDGSRKTQRTPVEVISGGASKISATALDAVAG